MHLFSVMQARKKFQQEMHMLRDCLPFVTGKQISCSIWFETWWRYQERWKEHPHVEMALYYDDDDDRLR
jgi:hypothetical protein